jgi:pimeloyl-ACP methyl ester carboxylesterase
VALAIAAVALAGCGGGDDAAALTAPAGDPQLPPAQLGAAIPKRYRDAPRALVILIRGGGWEGPLPALVRAQQGPARDLRRQGFAVLNPDYRAGERGLRDLLVRYDEGRRAYPDTPVCLYGQSAGATLALLIAAKRPETACVISQAGPTDLRALARQRGGGETSRLATVAFGRARLGTFSPVRVARRIRARVLQISALNDPLVPAAQARELDRLLPDAELVELPAGDAPFVHSSVDGGALTKALERLAALLDDAAAGGR